MRTIIATIKTAHLGNIRRGEKCFEVRKNAPSLEPPFRVLLCESGTSGMIKAEFVCDYVRCVHTDEYGTPIMVNPVSPEACCLSMGQLVDYANNKPLYCWHISQMVDYCNTKGRRVRHISEYGLKRPPRSWQYVKEERKWV